MSEILSYEKFVENLRAYLLDALNLQEERIYFKVKDDSLIRYKQYQEECFLNLIIFFDLRK